ncbi:Hypothetical predicted protein, partial [Paramuricea clavata]
MPTKLYYPDTQDFSIHNLPIYNIVSYQLSIAMNLGSLRYDKLFDYSDNLADDQAKVLVKKYYDDLHGEVNKLIIKRNCKRQLVGNSRHVRSSKFDFDHLARELDEQEIFTQEERGIPHLDLAKFFDRINDFADQSPLKKEIEEDSEYRPKKKEDLEKLVILAMIDENALSGVPTE